MNYILFLKTFNEPSSNLYLEVLFKVYILNWEQIHSMPYLSTYSAYMRSFQYKILNNVLFFNKKLDIHGITNSPPALLVDQPMKQHNIYLMNAV